MKKLAAVFAILSMVGCAVAPQYFDGESVTYEHGTARFNDVMADASKQCASVGKLVKHERTDCPYRCVSTFTCNERKK